MKVIVSVGGRFHAFHLARELEKRGALLNLITAYPAYAVRRAGISGKRIISLPAKEVLERLWNKLPLAAKKTFNAQYFLHELFDKQASIKIKSADIFVGWSSFSLHALKRARDLGARIVVERGSSHILYQDKILKEEYARWGIQPTPFDVPHPRIIEKELQEYAEADYISIPSSFVKKTFIERDIPEKKLIQIPYGVDLSMFHQSPKRDKVFRVIVRANLTLRKGIQYILPAFADLRLQNAELLLIGSVSEEIKPILKKYQGRYTIVANQPMEKLAAYYSRGSVFVMPSIEEGLALVQPQAMACGLPVIATANTGAADIIRDGRDGFIIPIRDKEALKEKILYLYDNPEICRRMGDSAKEYVSRGLTWNDYGDKITAAYKKIISAQ